MARPVDGRILFYELGTAMFEVSSMSNRNPSIMGVVLPSAPLTRSTKAWIIGTKVWSVNTGSTSHAADIGLVVLHPSC